MWYDSTFEDETSILPWNNKRQSPRYNVPHSRRMEISRSKESFNGYIGTIITFQSTHFGICCINYLIVLTLLFSYEDVQRWTPCLFTIFWKSMSSKKWLPKDFQFHTKSQNYFTGILCTLMQKLQKTLKEDSFATVLQTHHIQNKLLS